MRYSYAVYGMLFLGCFPPESSPDPLPGVSSTPAPSPRIEFKVTGTGVTRNSLVADYPLCELTGTSLKFYNVNDQSNPSLVLTVNGFAYSKTDPLTDVTGYFQDGTSLFPGVIYRASAASNCQFILGYGANAKGLTATYTCGNLRDASGNTGELSLGKLTCCVDCQ